jgi:hypothetical protein
LLTIKTWMVALAGQVTWHLKDCEYLLDNVQKLYLDTN